MALSRPLALALAALALAGCGGTRLGELPPVRRSGKYPPPWLSVPIARDGKALGGIAVMTPKAEMSRTLQAAVRDLQHFLERSTGAKLPIQYEKTDGAVIVIGNWEHAVWMGMRRGEEMPVEGFGVVTVERLGANFEVTGGPRSAVCISGRDGEIATKTRSEGTAWGIYDFLERVVGIRWYWPGETGCSVPEHKTLVVAPLWYEDAPVFRKREIWPSGGPSVTRDTGPHHRRMRSHDSWPIRLQVHSPTGWPELYGKTRPECFQLRSDGERNMALLCYGHPRTLETYLETIAAFYEKGDARAWAGKPPVGNAITVSPNDMAPSCRCGYCRKLWQPDAGQYGTASKVLATFTASLAREVKTRWPDKTVIYLPYQNYTEPPEGVTFPDNVEVQLCGMPGLARYNEPSIAASEQANIDGWVGLTGRKIQNWHYSCWPADQTKAAYQYPHVVQRHYAANRDKTVGSFINGAGDHWPRLHISLYVWMKALWNPDFDVDAVIDEFCRRMFGPAADTMHELVTMQIDGWEKSRWPGGNLSPKAIYEISYPRKDVLRMEALLKAAREQAAGDELILKRLDYYAGPMEVFFNESKAYAEGSQRTVLVAKKVGEDPVIDGKLGDDAWKQAEAVSLIRALDRKQPKPQFPTTLKAVWTLDGVTFGFRMAEPAPHNLARDIRGRDDSLAWWNDNVEIFLDVAGQRLDYYQLIVNPNAAILDGHGRDTEWTCEGLKAKAHVGADFWSLEVYVPYAAFTDAVKPGTGVEWFGNFTRHRVCDKKPREYQRLNTTYAGPSNNMMAFGPIRFVE